MHFPDQIRGLPKFDGPFDAFKLQAKGCDETENVGVITNMRRDSSSPMVVALKR